MTNNIDCQNKNSNPLYHSPLIVRAETQSTYRKRGFVTWPEKNTISSNKEEGSNNSGVINFIKKQFRYINSIFNRIKGSFLLKVSLD